MDDAMGRALRRWGHPRCERLDAIGEALGECELALEVLDPVAQRAQWVLDRLSDELRDDLGPGFVGALDELAVESATAVAHLQSVRGALLRRQPPLQRLAFDVPVLLISSPNRREHWAARARRMKDQRQATVMAWMGSGRPRPSYPARVTITRIGPGTLDSDNLVASAKAVRDELAECFGLRDDAGPEITWVVEQVQDGKTAGTQVLIEAESIATVGRRRGAS